MDKDMKRFLQKVEKTSDCWLWKAQILPSGYGGFHLKKNMTAHRASWILHFGKIPSKLCVCHKCDKRECVNPNHLFLGTHKQNSQDMVKKGRSSKGDKNGSSKLSEKFHKEILYLYKNGISQRELAKKYDVHQKTIFRIVHIVLPIKKQIGENNFKSKLTKNKVLEMRKIYKNPYGYHRIAKMFNVSKATATRAIKGVTWKHI